MYNLRFYLNDDDKIIKCDYKNIPEKDQLDLIFYNELILKYNDANKMFHFLTEHDLNHKCTIKKDYILHEFVVPIAVIRNLNDKMAEYKKEIDEKNTIKQSSQKFNTKQKQTNLNTKAQKKRKYVLRHENKYKRRRAIVTLLILLTLSSSMYEGAQISKGVINKNNKSKDEIVHYLSKEELKNTTFSNNNIAQRIQDINKNNQSNEVDIPSISGMVDSINKNLEENNFDYTLDINTEDWTGTKKYIDCYNNYYPLIEKYANMYGIDPKVALAIACHERGEHSSEIDSGGGLGLYQIQVDIWDGNTVKAFNFEKNSWEEYNIQLDNIRQLENNIKAGMMIYQECLIHDDYNLAMSVQEYNFGHGGLMASIDAASKDLGQSIETLEKNGNCDWFDYRTYNRSAAGYQMGDPEYVENVFKYINDNEILRFKTPDNEEISIKYHNKSNDMTLG